MLVLGAEREGLPTDVLERCDERASIPQPGGGESLNVAMAGAVALYELARRKTGNSHRHVSATSVALGAWLGLEAYSGKP